MPGNNSARSNSYRQALLVLAGFFLVLVQLDAVSAPLNCSNVSKVIADADISYSEGDSFRQYEVSYDSNGYHWLGTTYEFLPPHAENTLLAGVDFEREDELTTDIAANYKTLLIESNVHPALGESQAVSIDHGLTVTFEAVDESLPFRYGFHARRSGDRIQVFSVTGVPHSSDAAPSADKVVEAVENLVKSCQYHET